MELTVSLRGEKSGGLRQGPRSPSLRVRVLFIKADFLLGAVAMPLGLVSWNGVDSSL